MSVATSPVPAPRRLGVPARPWAILAVALAVRVLIVLATPNYSPFGDPADYDRIGRFLQYFGRYPPSTFADPASAAALRPPGYPYFLAGVYEIFGVRWTVVRLIGALLGTAAVGLLWGIVHRVWDRRLATWTAAVAAVLPSLVWVGGGLTAESLFIPLLIGAVWAAVRHRDAAAGARWAFAAGVLLGLAVLTRTNGAIVLLPLLVAAWVPRRRWRDPVILLVGFALALAPWTVRNAVVFGAFAPLGTQSGFTMIGNYNAVAAEPGDYMGAWHLPASLPELQPVLSQPGTNEADVDADLRHRAIEYAAHHPGYVVSSSWRHTTNLFQVNTRVNLNSGNSFREMGMPHWTWTPVTAAFWVLLAASIGGLVLLVRRRRTSSVGLWLWAVPVVTIAGVIPLLGPPRYRIPIDPFLAILAAVALMAAWDAVRARRGPAAD